ncbi:hypothetical protein NQ176_g4077 [Zarea fungicola]|uniref:Uncharacterized protein n=1 Tax=Zarea fungicola TaxID=93591 RepID=A0ACC1NFY1_9HYPO|nr:hypothetical protein NQ176_g4077 [Lecanicillium fungicola]
MEGNQCPLASQSRVEDLSGLGLSPGGNPYAAFIDACQDNHSEIQSRYEAHRTTRNSQQKDRFLSAEYQKLELDQHLFRIVHPNVEPGFRDERNCFVIWARPPDHTIRLALQVQEMLKEAAKIDRSMVDASTLHALDCAGSGNVQESKRDFVDNISWEVRTSPPAVDDDDPEGVAQSDSYTYHHLRRDVFNQIQHSGLEVGSRYQVPSAHITLGRYVSNEDHDTPEKRKAWIETLENINKWLAENIWDNSSADYIGEWVVGQETGLDARSGVLWYGGGRTIQMGEGF